ncbi:transcriptional regulator [Natrarchaeobius oligotrophus]|uniref:Transcriptional regulator n=2 Tax=Natrarchaeobius TaxID=2501796 RepID=A0A3N6LZW0_NATCH|nr:transcriptional regulator [Natrarchaeobius chitinivorans]
MFDVLSHSTRRQILVELADHNLRTEAAFETEEFAADGNSDSPETELHHIHLPNLADAGFINWGPRTETITRGPRFSEIEPLLVVIDDHKETLPVDWP